MSKFSAIADTPVLKQALRQRIITQRDALTTAERARADMEISSKILDLQDYKAAKTVMGYMNFGSEFNSAAWVRQALEEGKQVLLPLVDKIRRELCLYRVNNLDTQLAPGSYGIREPLPHCCEPAELSQVEFILLPGVAFSRDGARLGYGGGFYDKLLARLQHAPALVAAAYSVQLVPEVPQEATDRKVEWLVTEKESIHCNEQVQ